MSAEPVQITPQAVAVLREMGEPAQQRIRELELEVAQLRRAANLANAALAILGSGDLTGRDGVAYAQTAHADLLALIPAVTS